MNSIRTRLAAGASALIVGIFAVVFLFVHTIHLDSFKNTKQLADRTIEDFLMMNWEKQISSLAQMYADQLVRPVYAKDLQAIRDLTVVIGEQEFVSRIFVLDSNNMILGDGTWESQLLGEQYDEALLDSGSVLRVLQSPIRIGSSSLGLLIIGFNASQANRTVEAIHNETEALFNRSRMESAYRLGLLTLAALVSGLLAAYGLSRSMTRPLLTLAAATEKIGRNEYDISVPLTRSDEIGDLARTLRRMADTLRATTVTTAYLEQILASMPVGIAITGTDGTIISANASFLRLCERSKPNENISCLLTIGPDEFASLCRSLQEGVPLECLDIVLKGQNVVRDALLSGVLINSSEPGEQQFLFSVHDITERKDLERELWHIALHDHLTGLPNRRNLFEIIETELQAFHQRGSKPFWLVFVDLDHFKDINDSHGHYMGDLVLQAIARRLVNVSRDEDVVGRLSGDEFLVLLRGDIAPRLAETIAERMLRAVRAPIRLNELTLSISASIGLACSTSRHQTADDMVVEADGAMYHAKMNGKNRLISICEASRQNSSRHSVAMQQ